MPTLDLFPKPIKKRRVMMHMVDVGVSPFCAGAQCAEFECKKCGANSGWLHGFETKTEVLRGIPCENCNPPEADQSETAQ